MNANLAYRFVEANGITPEKAQSERDCACFAGDLCEWLEAKGIASRMLWLEDWEAMGLVPVSDQELCWRHHCVVEAVGLIHDLWYPQPLPLKEYLRTMFPGFTVQVEDLTSDDPDLFDLGVFEPDTQKRAAA